MVKRLLFALLVAPLLSLAAAQPLADLAPAESVVALGIGDAGIPFDTLPADLGALDWQGAAATVARLTEALAEGSGMPLGPAGEFGDMLGDVGDGVDDALGELIEACPPAADALPDDPLGLLGEGLLTVSVSEFNPLPVVTALARPSDPAAAAALQDALVGCFADGPSFDEGGVPLWVLGDGSELPLVAGRVGDVFVLSSNPDVARGVVRRAGGADEPSLADSRVWRERSRIEGAGLGFTVDLARVADLVDAFVPRDMGDPEFGYLLERGTAALRTLGGFAGELSAPAEGLAFEGVLAVDPAGGDPALADLLLCDTCSVSRAFLAPAGSVAVTSESVPIRGLVRYIERFVEGLAAAEGEDFDLRAELQAEFGVDLDTLLLDWVGEQLHTVVIEPFAPELGALTFGSERALIVPVASADAAEAGLEAIGELLAPFRDELGGALALGGGFAPAFASIVATAGIDPGPSAFEELSDLSALAVRDAEYRDVAYRRIQVGFGFDVAVGLVGNNLVIATPSSAIRPVVDTFRGADSALDARGYREAIEAAPAGSTEVVWAEPARGLRGAAELADVLSQPVAAAARAALEVTPVRSEMMPFEEVEEVTEESFPLPPSGYPLQTGSAAVQVPSPIYPIDTGATSPPELEPRLTTGTLEPGETRPDGDVAEYYDLGMLPGDVEVRVVLTSDEFDTYLRLIDPESGQVLLENDDAPDTSRSELAFVTESGRDYWVEVSSWSGSSTGPYTLEYTQQPAESEAADSPFESAPTIEPGTTTGQLSPVDTLPNDEIGDLYDLGVLPEGAEVRLVLTSDEFDTYLRLIDPDAATVLLENDDAPDTRRSELTFTADGERRFWVEVGSFFGSDIGSYELEFERVGSDATEAEADDGELETTDEATEAETEAETEIETEVEPPSFAEFLELAELPGEALHVLADHLGTFTATTAVEEESVVFRALLRIAW